MMSISAVNSYQISAVTTSAKTVHMKDILLLRKALKYVENQITTFNQDLKNPTSWQRPGANRFEQVLTDLSVVDARSTQLAEKIHSSSYPHHASKMANLEKIKAKIDTLSKSANANFNRSQARWQFMREQEDQHREGQVRNANSRFQRQQYANAMINSGRGSELYNGGMVK